MKSILTDRKAVSTTQLTIVALMAGILLGSGFLAMQLFAVEPTIDRSDKIILKGLLDIGIVYTFSWDTVTKSTYSTDDIGDYTASTNINVKLNLVSSTPTYTLISRSNYEADVGINTVIDDWNGDIYYKDGHQTKSIATYLDVPYVAADDYIFGSAQDSPKCWWDQKEKDGTKADGVPTNSTWVPMVITMKSTSAATNRHLWDAQFAIPVRAKYTPSSSSSLTVSGKTSCYVPFAPGIEKEDIEIDFTSYKREDLGKTPADWNGILWESVESIKASSFRLELFWGAFSLNIQTGQSDKVYSGEIGVFSWQDPIEYRESNWLYKIR